MNTILRLIMVMALLALAVDAGCDRKRGCCKKEKKVIKKECSRKRNQHSHSDSESCSYSESLSESDECKWCSFERIPACDPYIRHCPKNLEKISVKRTLKPKKNAKKVCSKWF